MKILTKNKANIFKMLQLSNELERFALGGIKFIIHTPINTRTVFEEGLIVSEVSTGTRCFQDIYLGKTINEVKKTALKSWMKIPADKRTAIKRKIEVYQKLILTKKLK